MNPSLFLEPLLYDLSVTLSCVLATTAGAVVHDVVVDFFLSFASVSFCQ